VKKIKYSSLFLPNQPLLKKYFKLKNFEDHLYSFIAKYSNIIIPKKKYKLFNPSGIAVEEMASNPISLSFLNFICYLIKPKNILEIGSFIGLSTMELSTHLKKNGKVTAIEKYDKFYNIAKKNFKINKLDKKINIILGEALDVLSSNKLKKKFDLIFIDGNKENYKEIFQLCEKKLSKDGIIIIDNIFNQGDAMNLKPRTQKGAGVKRLLEYLKNKKMTKCILPFYDGIMLVKKN
jgi:caffeoyl-CoA O-methyltransferase